MISAAIRRGLIEAQLVEASIRTRKTISAAIRRGLIEAGMRGSLIPVNVESRFPRPFAAASLKPAVWDKVGERNARFPRPFAAASLKHDSPPTTRSEFDDFRGHSPRPH